MQNKLACNTRKLVDNQLFFYGSLILIAYLTVVNSEGSVIPLILTILALCWVAQFAFARCSTSATLFIEENRCSIRAPGIDLISAF